MNPLSKPIAFVQFTSADKLVFSVIATERLFLVGLKQMGSYLAESFEKTQTFLRLQLNKSCYGSRETVPTANSDFSRFSEERSETPA